MYFVSSGIHQPRNKAVVIEAGAMCATLNLVTQFSVEASLRADALSLYLWLWFQDDGIISTHHSTQHHKNVSCQND